MSDLHSPAMTSYRPYLLRALWQWITDNGMTAHVLVDASSPGVRVPAHTIKDGKVVLNIADRAVARLQLGDDMVSFSARFAGVSHAVMIPVPAVLAIYARETGQGMALPEDVNTAASSDPQSASAAQESTSSDVQTSTTDASDMSDSEAADTDPSGQDDDAPPSRRGAHLRIVK